MGQIKRSSAKTRAQISRMRQFLLESERPSKHAYELTRIQRTGYNYLQKIREQQFMTSVHDELQAKHFEYVRLVSDRLVSLTGLINELRIEEESASDEVAEYIKAFRLHGK